VKQVSKKRARAVSAHRRPGYLEAMESRASKSDDSYWWFLDADYESLAKEFALGSAQSPRSSGPGTELKALLAKIGIHASPTCKCNKMAKKMDEWGQESLNHIEEIVDVMEETAKKRGLPFMRAAGAAMVRVACWKARRKGNG
jgi:hypothetical protein